MKINGDWIRKKAGPFFGLSSRIEKKTVFGGPVGAWSELGRWSLVGGAGRWGLQVQVQGTGCSELGDRYGVRLSVFRVLQRHVKCYWNAEYSCRTSISRGIP